MEWAHRISGSGGRRLLLSYIDADREHSEREIIPYEISGSMVGNDAYPEAIEAFCLMRRANRTFRIDRIVTVADPATGEVLDLDDLLDEMAAGVVLPSAQKEPSPPSVRRIGKGMPIEAPTIQSSRLPLYRLAAGVLLGGYLVGRLRVLPWLLRLFHQRWGLWL